MREDKPIISVVVPVYNVENYLRRCVDSILDQTYGNLYVILVDDGSTDGSGRICDEYQNEDDRIHTIHQTNQGVSAARNNGICHSKGNWICFVDSDDWLPKDAIQILLSEHLDKRTFYIGQGMSVKEKQCKFWPSVFEDTEIVLGNCKSFDLLNRILEYGTPWAKLYNIDVIKENNLLFDETISFHEDHCFFFDYLSVIQKVRVFSKPVYYYSIECSRNSLSQAGKVHNPDKLLYSYEYLKGKLETMIDVFMIDKAELKSINTFLYSIKISAVRNAFKSNYSYRMLIKYSKMLVPEETRMYFYPKTRNGRILKTICCIESCFMRAIIFFILNKLRKL